MTRALGSLRLSSVGESIHIGPLASSRLPRWLARFTHTGIPTRLGDGRGDPAGRPKAGRVPLPARRAPASTVAADVDALLPSLAVTSGPRVPRRLSSLSSARSGSAHIVCAARKFPWREANRKHH